MPRELLVKKERAADPSDVVEPDPVRVRGLAPHEDNVVHEHAAVVSCGRDVDRVHAPTDYLDPTEGRTLARGYQAGRFTTLA